MTVNSEKMKALAPATRVEACIAEAMEKYAGGSPGRDLTYYQNVHQDLAPLARQLERERDELRAEVERLQAVMKQAAIGYESGFFSSSPNDLEGRFVLHYGTPAEAESAFLALTTAIESAIEKEKANA
jgi:hypothetical protein